MGHSDFEAVREMVEAREERSRDREQAAFDAELTAVQTEIRALFVRIWAGELLLLPRLVYGKAGSASVKHDYRIEDAIGEAVAEGVGPAVAALKTMAMDPSADRDHLIGQFREAVTDQYVDQWAERIAEFRLGDLDDEVLP